VHTNRKIRLNYKIGEVAKWLVLVPETQLRKNKSSPWTGEIKEDSLEEGTWR
jgi:hypothetical protein